MDARGRGRIEQNDGAEQSRAVKRGVVKDATKGDPFLDSRSGASALVL